MKRKKKIRRKENEALFISILVFRAEAEEWQEMIFFFS